MIGIGNYRRSLFPRSSATGVEKQSPGLPAPPQPPFSYDYFVSPTGSASNDGSLASPWSLAYAIAGAGGLIVPGKHIGCRGGQYIDGSAKRFTIAGQKSTGYGDQAGKIIWRNYNGEHVEWICDSASKSIQTVEIESAFNWFWGIDAWRKHTDRYNYPGPGSNWWIKNASSDGVRLIHCWGHEGSNGLFTDSAIGNVVVYGCGFFHAGVDQGARAHGFYVHHTRDSGSVGSRFLISHCMSFDHLGNCGQIFASSAPEQLDDIDVEWLVSWGGGRIAATQGQQNLTFGGTDSANIPLRGFTGKHIISRNPPGYGRACLRMYNVASIGQDAILEDCYLVGGQTGQGVGRLAMGAMSWNSFQGRRNTMINLDQTQLISTDDNVYTGYTVWEDNVYYGSDPTALRWRAGSGFTDRSFTGWKTFTGLGSTGGHLDVANAGLPVATQVFAEPEDMFEYGRGKVIFFNWASSSRVAVDLSSILSVGDQIVVRNAQASSPERNPSVKVDVYDAPAGGNIVTTWTGVPVYFPTTGVTPPPMYGFNNAALNAALNPAPVTGPEFEVFIVSVT